MMSEKNENVVLPGEQVSTMEELIPGEGTFEEEGIIRAAIVGKYYVDKRNKKACVKPLTTVPVMVQNGDTVLARVRMVRSNMVIADVIHVKGKQRAISGDNNGTLKVAEISQSYIKDPATEFAAGDIIRAKVIQVRPNIQLSTKDRELGSILSLCKKCRNTLSKKGNQLVCENCGNKERRSTAPDYGAFDIDKL